MTDVKAEKSKVVFGGKRICECEKDKKQQQKSKKVNTQNQPLIYLLNEWSQIRQG